MAIELLRQIQEAEKKADEVRQDAAREARDIIKGVESAITAQNRQTSVELREKVQGVLGDARSATEDEIRTLEVRRASEREEVKKAARGKVKSAGQAIFERIVG